MKITKRQLRQIIRESIFKSTSTHSGGIGAAGDDRYHDLARAYHQQGGTTVGGRDLNTIPSDKEEVIQAIEHCRQWSKNYVEKKDTAPPPASYSRWPAEYLAEFSNGNITKRHLYFICDWCRKEVMGYGSNLLDKIRNDKRYGR